MLLSVEVWIIVEGSGAHEEDQREKLTGQTLPRSYRLYPKGISFHVSTEVQLVSVHFNLFSSQTFDLTSVLCTPTINARNDQQGKQLLGSCNASAS